MTIDRLVELQYFLIFQVVDAATNIQQGNWTTTNYGNTFTDDMYFPPCSTCLIFLLG